MAFELGMQRRLWKMCFQALLFQEIIKISGDDRIQDGFDNVQIFDTLNISRSRKLKDLF